MGQARQLISGHKQQKTLAASCGPISPLYRQAFWCPPNTPPNRSCTSSVRTRAIPLFRPRTGVRSFVCSSPSPTSGCLSVRPTSCSHTLWQKKNVYLSIRPPSHRRLFVGSSPSRMRSIPGTIFVVVGLWAQNEPNFSKTVCTNLQKLEQKRPFFRSSILPFVPPPPNTHTFRGGNHGVTIYELR